MAPLPLHQMQRNELERQQLREQPSLHDGSSQLVPDFRDEGGLTQQAEKLIAALGLGGDSDSPHGVPAPAAAPVAAPCGSSAAPIPAFASMRFGHDEVNKYEGPALRDALRRHGIDLYVAAPPAGSDISIQVMTALDNAQIFIALATSDYSEKTGNPVSSYEELSFWQSTAKKAGKPNAIPICMRRKDEEFKTEKEGVIAAKFLFNTNNAYLQWPVGSTRQQDGSCIVPEKIINAVVQVAQGVCKGASA